MPYDKNAWNDKRIRRDVTNKLLEVQEGISAVLRSVTKMKSRGQEESDTRWAGVLIEKVISSMKKPSKGE